MRRRTDVEITDLGSGIRQINEYDFVNCYLIAGEEKACLIDAGAGVADMAAVVKGLTDLPVTVLLTHAHADHAGGAVWFPEVHIHPLDLRPGRSCARFYQRLFFLHSHEYKRRSHGVPYAAAFQKENTPKFLPLNEGDRFDLGGRTVETYFTPGHTHGSLTFRDSLTGALFTGDNVNPAITLQFPRGDTVETWLQGAKRTLGIAGDAPMYAGHGRDPLPRAALETLIAWGEELVAAGNGRRGVRTKRGAQKYPCIVYKGNRVRSRN